MQEGKIKKQKRLPPICNDYKYFELPQGGEWVTLPHLGVFSGGTTPSKAKPEFWDGKIPWITAKDMKMDRIYDSQDHVTESALENGLSLLEDHAFLFVVRSGILKRRFPVAITKVQATVNQDLKILDLYEKELCDYLLIMMKSFESYILRNLTKTGTTVESLRLEEFSKHYFFVFPPRSQQVRIVAKVDELMAICDQIKACLNQARNTQLYLADSAAEHAVT